MVKAIHIHFIQISLIIYKYEKQLQSSYLSSFRVVSMLT